MHMFPFFIHYTYLLLTLTITTIVHTNSIHGGHPEKNPESPINHPTNTNLPAILQTST